MDCIYLDFYFKLYDYVSFMICLSGSTFFSLKFHVVF